MNSFTSKTNQLTKGDLASIITGLAPRERLGSDHLSIPKFQQRQTLRSLSSMDDFQHSQNLKNNPIEQRH